MKEIFDYIAKEWAVLRTAPFTFIGLAVVCLLGGVGIASWHDSGEIAADEAISKAKDGEIEARDGEIKARDGVIHRYKVALGLEAASQGNLIELTNDELRIKSLNTADKLRQVCISLRLRDGGPWKEQKTEVARKAQAARFLADVREVSDQIDKSVRSDSLLIDNELRRRLSPKAVAAIPHLMPSVLDAVTGNTPIEPLGFFSVGKGFSFGICTLSDGIEQMAKLLPSDGKN
jgi:hypothetical protein